MQTALSPRITGHPTHWARDMALVGGTTSLVVSALLAGLVPAGFAPAATLAGLATGAGLGAAMPALLDTVRGRVPIAALLLLGPLVGATWGGLTGLAACLVVSPTDAALGLVCGAIAGALQLGWWWFPYTFQTVRGGRRWPLVLLVVPACVLITPLTFWGAMLFAFGAGQLH